MSRAPATRRRVDTYIEGEQGASAKATAEGERSWTHRPPISMDRILGTQADYERMKSEKPRHSEPERLIDFYRDVLLTLSYEYGTRKHPIPDKRPLGVTPTLRPCATPPLRRIASSISGGTEGPAGRRARSLRRDAPFSNHAERGRTRCCLSASR